MSEDLTIDTRLREDARELLWRLRTGDGLSPEQRRNLETARDDLDYVLRTDERIRNAESVLAAARATA